MFCVRLPLAARWRGALTGARTGALGLAALAILGGFGRPVLAQNADESAPYARFRETTIEVEGPGRERRVHREELRRLGDQRAGEPMRILWAEEHPGFETTSVTVERIGADGRVVRLGPEAVRPLIGAEPRDPRAAARFAVEGEGLRSGETLVVTREERRRPGGPLEGFAFEVAAAAEERLRAHRVAVRLPEEWSPRVDRRHFEMESAASAGRREWRFTLRPLSYAPVEGNALSAFDRGAYLRLSTYTEAALAGSLPEAWARASAGNPALTARAAAILAEAGLPADAAPRLRARAIHDWIAARIRPRAVAMRTGDFAFAAPLSTLEAGEGDSRDHAVLGAALLGAAGIEARPILYRAGLRYRSSPFPAPDYDHMALDVPALGLIWDTTVPGIGFGTRHWAFAGKPAYRLEGRRLVPVVLPPVLAEENRIEIVAKLTVGADGLLSGSTETRAYGASRAMLAEQLRRSAGASEATFVQRLLRRQNYRGEARLERTAPQAAEEPDRVSLHFNLRGDDDRKGADAVPLGGGPRLVMPVSARLRTLLREGRATPFRCVAQDFRQNVRIALPAGAAAFDLPPSVSVDVPGATYRASYALEGDTLAIERHFRLNAPGPVCTARDLKEMAPAIRAAAHDLARGLRLGAED